MCCSWAVHRLTVLCLYSPGMLNRGILAWRGHAVACALLAALAPGVARAGTSSLDLGYDAFVLGFPAVSFAFRLDHSDSAYHILGEVHTNGVADMVVKYRLETHT